VVTVTVPGPPLASTPLAVKAWPVPDKVTFWVPSSVLTLSVAVCVAACVGEKFTLVSQKAPAARVPAQLVVAA